MIDPAIDIQKTPDTQQVVAGGTATFGITVTNTGDVALDGVTVTDPVAPDCDATIGTLAGGASTSYSCTMTVGADDFTNTASVTGDDPLGNTVHLQRHRRRRRGNPAIDIQKNPATQTILGGATATFNILHQHRQRPARQRGRHRRRGTELRRHLPVAGGRRKCHLQLQLDNVTGDFTNVAVVSAEHPASPDGHRLGCRRCRGDRT